MSTGDKKLLKCLWRLFQFVYIPFFFVLWLGGGYAATQSGKVRNIMGIATGISVTDIAAWQPLFGHFQSCYSWPDGNVSPRCDPIGWAYFPMFYIIERFNPPICLVTEEGDIIPEPAFPPNIRFHPWRGDFLRSVAPTQNTAEKAGDETHDSDES